MNEYNVSIEPTECGVSNMVITALDENHAKQQVSCFKYRGKNFVPISAERLE